MEYFISFLGIFGIILNLFIYQQKSKKAVLICKLSSDLIWAVHYLLLGAVNGCIIAVIGAFRELVFLNTDRKSKRGKIWMIVFMLTAVVSTLLTNNSVFSFFPMAASIISVFSFSMGVPRLSRVLAFPISVLMGLYSFFSGSWSGVINEILTVISSLAGIIRIDLRGKK